MSQWTSERAILRDLTRAQGGKSGPPRSLRPAERPPRAAAHEETEEEYFEQCVGDGGAPRRPDLGLIRHMLDMVREQNVSEDDPNVTDVAVISKLSQTCLEFIPTTKPPAEGSIQVNNNNSKPKRIKLRNIALESILQALECQEQTKDANVNDAPLKLLKPEDLIPNNPEGMLASPTHSLQHSDVRTSKCSEEDTNVEKVKTWLTQVRSPMKNKPVTAVLESTNMFKKKSKPIAPPGTGLNKDIRHHKPSSTRSDRTYVPSTTANDYYKKYLDKTQLMDSLHDDIWTKAEKEMKQIDENRRLAAAAAEPATQEEAGRGDLHLAGTESGGSIDGHEEFHNEIKRVLPVPALSAWGVVRLPSARHGGVGGAGGCAVCAALARWRPASSGPAAAREASSPDAGDDVDDGTPHSTPEWIRKDAAGLFD